jgi:hypothetical protein
MKSVVNIPVSSRIFIWSNSDLDGACSVILLGQIFQEFEYQSCFFGKFEENYTTWAKSNLENYDKVFVVGMVIDQKLLNKIDDPRLVIISDRGEKLTAYDSTLIIEESSSCSKLIYKKFKKVREFPINVKKLLVYVDDYNEYLLKHEESKYLNAIYRRLGYRNFYKFVDRFFDGFDGFTDTEINIAEGFFKEIENEVSTIDLYSGEFKGWKVLAVFSKLSVNEIAKELIDNHKADVIIVVNPDTKFVSFRKPIGSLADIVYMAENLCDGGGGEWASGGQMTEKFLGFTVNLSKNQ